MPSLPWSARNKPHDVEDDLKRLRNGLQTIPTETLVVSAIVLGSVTTLGSTALYRRFFKRIPTSEWITPNILKKKRWIKGVVTRCVCSIFSCDCSVIRVAASAMQITFGCIILLVLGGSGRSSSDEYRLLPKVSVSEDDAALQSDEGAQNWAVRQYTYDWPELTLQRYVAVHLINPSQHCNSLVFLCTGSAFWSPKSAICRTSTAMAEIQRGGQDRLLSAHS